MTSDKPHPDTPAPHQIFVGDIRETWKEDIVAVNDIMAQAGVSPPDNFLLEALDRPGGTSIKEFSPGASVDLREDDRKFFRITPGGGGFS